MDRARINDHLDLSHLESAIADLTQGRDLWAKTLTTERLTVLQEVKDALMQVASEWVETSSRKKLIPPGSPLEGEEWTTGPFAVMWACNGLIETLSQVDGKRFLDGLRKRQTITGQLAVRVVPHNIRDRLLLPGISAEVWMKPDVTADNLAAHTAGAYDVAPQDRQGRVALVLGAGNISSIAPLDCFQKLFLEHQVVLLKLNPVNDYLHDVLQTALEPLIRRNALRIVRGDRKVGAWLTTHLDIDELHITGAGSTHDAIVWGMGAEGEANKRAATPKNPRRITSELGAVCPTIVVPGPWSQADLEFQAQNIATQKMHNSGFNCIACQVLVIPERWKHTQTLLDKVKARIAKATRLPFYPGTEDRLEKFATHGNAARFVSRGKAPDAVISHIPDDNRWQERNEVFAPALTVHRISQDDPELFLRDAIAYANDRLYGTLGGNILIHPKTLQRIGRKRFEELLADFRYGCIAVNGWTGLGFLLSQTPWGAFPGHTLDDVQSGIGTVHNTFMFDCSQRTVVTAPFAPFPRSFLNGEFTLLPKPPWFITHRNAQRAGKALTRFQHRRGWLRLPAVLWTVLNG